MRAVGAAAVLAVIAGLAVPSGGEAVAAAASDAFRVSHFRLRAAPVAVTASHGSVWVVEEAAGLKADLVRLDATTGRRLATFFIGRTGPDFGAAAASGAYVWAAAGNHVIRVDVANPNDVRRAALPGQAAAITLGLASAWVASIGQQADTITRLDSTSLAVRARIRLSFQPLALAAGLGSVWLASPSGLWRIDPASNQSTPAPDPAALPVSLTLAGNRIWIIQQDQEAASVDRAGRIRARIALPFPPSAGAVTPGRLWVTNNCGCRIGRLAVLDTHTHRLLADLPIGETPVDVTADRDGVWVATFADETVSHVRP